MDMRFGTWNVSSHYRIGSLKTAARNVGKYKLEMSRWEKGGAERAEDYTSFCVEGNGDNHLGTGFFVHRRIVSIDGRVEFISDRLSYIILRGR
jgi:hypothetical protein